MHRVYFQVLDRLKADSSESAETAEASTIDKKLLEQLVTEVFMFLHVFLLFEAMLWTHTVFLFEGMPRMCGSTISPPCKAV